LIGAFEAVNLHSILSVSLVDMQVHDKAHHMFDRPGEFDGCLAVYYAVELADGEAERQFQD
jgi:hypothetical protein